MASISFMGSRREKAPSVGMAPGAMELNRMPCLPHSTARLRIMARHPAFATAGKPNSRATIAPWERTPPVSMTRPFARMNSGTQAGSVVGQTKMYASVGAVRFVGSCSTSAGPSAMPAEIGTPCSVSAAVGVTDRPSASKSSLKRTCGSSRLKAISRRRRRSAINWRTCSRRCNSGNSPGVKKKIPPCNS